MSDEEELKATRKLNGAERNIEINGYKLYKPKITVENLKVGYYVRTKSQGIKRIDTVWENKTVNKYGYKIGSEWDGILYSTIKTTDILKFSPNIIDLIEEGDYVNGMLVTDKAKNERVINICFYNGLYANNLKLVGADIKTIVTHEQFNSVAYRVEE